MFSVECIDCVQCVECVTLVQVMEGFGIPVVSHGRETDAPSAAS